MENVKNNFEELKKLLLGALEILEQTNCGLMERVKELEGKVEVLDERIKELEQHAVADNEVYAPTASLFAASVAEVNDKVAETSEAEVFEAEQTETEQVETAQEEVEQFEAEQAEQVEIEQAEAEQAEQEDAELEDAELEEPAESAGVTTAEPYELADTEQFADAEQFVEEQQLDGEQPVPEFEAGSWLEAEKETVGTIMINDYVADEQRRIVNEAAKPDWYDWEVDYPAEYVDDVYKGISFNDRYEFIKELFNVNGSLDEAEVAFKETLDTINNLEHFKQVVAYVRERFPQWDEQSDEVYRFYMAVRRKFNK